MRYNGFSQLFCTLIWYICLPVSQPSFRKSFRAFRMSHRCYILSHFVFYLDGVIKSPKYRLISYLHCFAFTLNYHISLCTPYIPDYPNILCSSSRLFGNMILFSICICSNSAFTNFSSSVIMSR